MGLLEDGSPHNIMMIGHQAVHRPFSDPFLVKWEETPDLFFILLGSVNSVNYPTTTRNESYLKTVLFTVMLKNDK